MARQIDQELETRPSAPGRTFRGAALRHIAMPMGGIGTGQISLCGDGALRQWEIVNQAYHLAFVPDSFFAISARAGDAVEEPVTRILQSRQALDWPDTPTPLVNDDDVPPQQQELLRRFSGVDGTTFTAAYPFARIAYEDAALPVEVELEAYSPFVPTDVDASELPAVIFTFRLRNTSSATVRGVLGGTLKNIVGWDGVAPIEGNRCDLFGGNTNRVATSASATSVVFENPSLPADHPGRGQLALAALGGQATPLPRWDDPGEFMRSLNVLNGTERHGKRSQEGGTEDAPSPPGETRNGGLIVPFELEPGASDEVTFVLAWSFPNHYVNFDPPARVLVPFFRRSRAWLGNAYALRFPTALDVVDYIAEHRTQLEGDSRAWSDLLATSSLPPWLADFLGAQGALLRSPTTFRTEDGRFYGFEGTQGASTAMLRWRGYGGSCPLNCTHVWNYEQAVSRLFPSLERTMRETDLDYLQAPEGYIPHRVVVPLEMKQLWDVTIGGPDNPALDGMLGTVLKVYREARQGAGEAWLARYWPKVKRLLTYIETKWDPDNDGILDGEQPNTFDIAFYGPNMFIGSYWLAALRAGEELARLQGDQAEADRLHGRFRQASAAYDELLWSGEYYIQVRDESASPEQQYGEGCLSDQLVGQWWAHQLELGYLLPEDHVRTALRSIVRYNFRQGFHGWEPQERVFADDDDAGLLNVTWPRGGQPEVPTRYWDEVWTGTEYQVAAHCIMEGLVEDGLRIAAAARDRYDGTKRNPYNDIECGDHYARAMSGWSLLEAFGGHRYDATRDAHTLAPVDDSAVRDAGGRLRVPFVAGTGWGKLEHLSAAGWSMTVLYGEVRIGSLTVPAPGTSTPLVRLNGTPVAPRVTHEAGKATLTFGHPLMLRPGESLGVALEPDA